MINKCCIRKYVEGSTVLYGHSTGEIENVTKKTRIR
jgi:hypothetical protein